MGMKDELEKRLQRQLIEWKAEADKMEAEARAKEAEAASAEVAAAQKRERYEKIKDIRESLANAEEKLDRLRRSGEDSIDELKADIESTWNALRRKVESQT